VWSWRRMEKIIWNEHVKKELHKVKKERNFLRTIKRGKEEFIGLFLRRYYFLNTFWKE